MDEFKRKGPSPVDIFPTAFSGKSCCGKQKHKRRQESGLEVNAWLHGLAL